MPKTSSTATQQGHLRVVVTHAPAANSHALRAIAHGAGLDCEAADCVPYGDLSRRLAGGNTDLVLVEIGHGVELGLKAIEAAAALTLVPIVAIGPRRDPQVVERVRRAGALDLLDSGDLRQALDDTLDQLSIAGTVPRRRGSVVSVFAPTPGSGGTTVALNLAGTLAATHPGDVLLVELTAHAGDVPGLLNLTPKHTLADVCRRWQRLDVTSLRNSLMEHPAGLATLSPAENTPVECELTCDAVRRVTVLARTMFEHTLLALDSRLADETIEAMTLSDCVLMVVRGDVPALRRARSALDLAVELGVEREQFKLVINRSGQAGQLAQKQIEQALSLTADELLPDDPASVNRAANEGKLLIELSRRSAIAGKFAALAERLKTAGQGTPRRAAPPDRTLPDMTLPDRAARDRA